ncbi:cytochrome c1 [Novosphingopyxis iocasae]|uniref:cytochrome c1 n=1 Tax=Novosphingopyxis iocasae TaxID=2762729 RepID=UPI001651AFF9|nr:cytochrome c1 [Novosphingopyxis iocasae]
MKLLLNLIGAFFVAMLVWSFGAGLYSFITEPPKEDVVHEFHEEPLDIHYPSDGPLGTFDKAQLQRGLKVFREVCAACHSLNQVTFRSLTDLGYSEDQVKTIAAEWPIETPSINPDTGEAATRPPLPIDHFPAPYPNDVAARAANNNAVPPDLSLITKAREGGAEYVDSLLRGYRPVPADLPEVNRPTAGLHYNPWFANLNIAMPPPLTSDGQVTYDDGTASTVEQMSKDVSAFLIWTAEPKLPARKQTGWAVILFLIFATALGYMAYRNIWIDQKH